MVSVTDCGELYVPPGGLKDGAAAGGCGSSESIRVKLLELFAVTAMASMVSVDETAMGPV